MNSASLCSPAGRYDNPIPPRYLAPIDFLKIPALLYSSQRLYARGLTLIGVLATLAGREGQWAMIFFNDGNIKEWAAWAEAA
jgi:hypothetical protein